ncbi:MAG: hypothetical protein JXQ29_17640 [Planctomycetes bacterium]|nr:hypothetical protein [Planctomycetota bacterium]
MSSIAARLHALRTPHTAAGLCMVLCAVAVGFAFGPTLDGGFFMEDHHFLRELHARGGIEQTLQDLGGNWLGFPGYPYYRPLVTASLALDHAVFGLRPQGYHLSNLLLHFANTLLVLTLVRRVYPPGGRAGALAAALLFATHPIHPNAVGWVAARADLLVAFGTLGMLTAYSAAWQKGRRGGCALGTALFAAALLAKESGVVAVVLALFLPAPDSWRRRLGTLLPAGVLLGAYLAVRFAVLDTALNLHEAPHAVTAGALDPFLATVRALAAQLVHVLNPSGAPRLEVAAWPLLFLLPAVAALARPAGRRALLFAVVMTAVSLLPMVPLLEDTHPTLFAGYSRYWYLALIGLVVPATLAVGGAGRAAVVPLAALGLLAAIHGVTSRAFFARDLRRPAAMAAEVAAWVNRTSGGSDHDPIHVFLRASDDRYAGVHLNPLAVTAAAVPPFVSREIPLYPLFVAELTELVRVHGGHRAFLVVTLDAATGGVVVAARMPRVPRWQEATRDGPYRLAPGLWKDIDGQSRSPLSFDFIALEGVKGQGRLLLQIETDAGVFAREELADGTGKRLVFRFRREDDFLRARAVSRVRLEALSAPESPLEGVVEIDRIVIGDDEARPLLESPPAGSTVAVGQEPLRLVWSERAPRELAVRFITALGCYPPPGRHALRPRDGIEAEVRKRLVVGSRLGSGWFLVFAVPPPVPAPSAAPGARVPLVALRAAVSR